MAASIFLYKSCRRALVSDPQVTRRASRVLASAAEIRPVRHIDIPITPERVWNILQEKGVAE
jgi:hypothetical protein